MGNTAIPVTKAVAAKNMGVPDNGFNDFTAMGSSMSDEIDYEKIPHLTTMGQWLLVVPFRNKIKNKSKVVIPDSAIKKAESYLVIGTNESLNVKVGAVVKIMESAKRLISIEAALSPTFLGLDVYAIAPESIFWVVPDSYIDRLVL